VVAKVIAKIILQICPTSQGIDSRSLNYRYEIENVDKAEKIGNVTLIFLEAKVRKKRSGLRKGVHRNWDTNPRHLAFHLWLNAK
jgi:hypothetical protein